MTHAQTHSSPAMLFNPLFYLAAIPAIVLIGLSKGGFSGLSLLSLPLLALVMSPVQAAAVMLPILIVQDVVSVWAFRHTWDKRNLLILVPGAMVGILAGYLLAAKVPEAAVELAIGVISVVFAIRRLIIERRPVLPDPAPADVPRGLFWGSLIGFTSMVAHAGGPPFQIYVMPQRLPPNVFVGTSAIVFALVNWLKVPPYIALGQFTPENLTISVAMFPVAILSTWLGVVLVRRVSGVSFYTIVYWLVIVVGAKLVYDGATGLIHAYA